METLLGKTIEELGEVALRVGLPRFAARQMAEWIYQKGVNDIDEMTNLSKQGRERLRSEYVVGRYDAKLCRLPWTELRNICFLLPMGTMWKRCSSPITTAPRCVCPVKWVAKWDVGSA